MPMNIGSFAMNFSAVPPSRAAIAAAVNSNWCDINYWAERQKLDIVELRRPTYEDVCDSLDRRSCEVVVGTSDNHGTVRVCVLW